jgi:hypothetical protein
MVAQFSYVSEVSKLYFIGEGVNCSKSISSNLNCTKHFSKILTAQQQNVNCSKLVYPFSLKHTAHGQK